MHLCIPDIATSYLAVMALQNFYLYTVSLGVVLFSAFLMRRRRVTTEEKFLTKSYPLASLATRQLPGYIQELSATIPNCVILQSNVAAFQDALDYSWAQQVREIVPACIVRPYNVQELSKAIVVLKEFFNSSHDTRMQNKEFFTVRSGGANPGLGAATLKNGVVIDLSRFREVIPNMDGSTVTVGTGARWIDVYKTLDKKGLTVMGGRSSPVGVGGLTLQGTRICCELSTILLQTSAC